MIHREVASAPAPVVFQNVGTDFLSVIMLLIQVLFVMVPWASFQNIKAKPLNDPCAI